MRFLYDMTEVLVWEGQHTGIQRVVNGYGNSLKYIKPDTIFFYIENGIGYNQQTKKKLEYYSGDVLFTACANWDRKENLIFFQNAKKEGVLCVNLYHDLTPIIIPHSFKPGFSERFSFWLEQTVNLFDFHICNSENTKKDLLEYKKSLQEENINVVRFADQIDSVQRLEKKEESNYLSSLGIKDYILSVGTVEFRKNHLTLLNAFRILDKQNFLQLPQLVIAGRFGWLDLGLKYQVENDPLLKGKIIFVEAATDSQLDALYRNCKFTLYPSIYEGWGLPIGESLNYGKPCIVADNSSLSEIAPNLTITARTLDPYEWADKIIQLWCDHDFYNDLITKINVSFKSTDWISASEQVLRIIEKYYADCQGREVRLNE